MCFVCSFYKCLPEPFHCVVYVELLVINFWLIQTKVGLVLGKGYDVLAWGGGRASLGGIKGACPAPLISPN